MKQKTNNLLFEDFQTPAMAIDDVDTFEAQCTDWPESQLTSQSGVKCEY